MVFYGSIPIRPRTIIMHVISSDEQTNTETLQQKIDALQQAQIKVNSTLEQFDTHVPPSLQLGVPPYDLVDGKRIYRTYDDPIRRELDILDLDVQKVYTLAVIREQIAYVTLPQLQDHQARIEETLSAYPKLVEIMQHLTALRAYIHQARTDPSILETLENRLDNLKAQIASPVVDVSELSFLLSAQIDEQFIAQHANRLLPVQVEIILQIYKQGIISLGELGQILYGNEERYQHDGFRKSMLTRLERHLPSINQKLLPFSLRILQTNQEETALDEKELTIGFLIDNQEVEKPKGEIPGIFDTSIFTIDPQDYPFSDLLKGAPSSGEFTPLQLQALLIIDSFSSQGKGIDLIRWGKLLFPEEDEELAKGRIRNLKSRIMPKLEGMGITIIDTTTPAQRHWGAKGQFFIKSSRKEQEDTNHDDEPVMEKLEFPNGVTVKEVTIQQAAIATLLFDTSKTNPLSFEDILQLCGEDTENVDEAELEDARKRGYQILEETAAILDEQYNIGYNFAEGKYPVSCYIEPKK